MKKWIFIGIGAIVAVIIAVIIFGLSNLGTVIKRAVNLYGPQITKTELHVGDVGVSIFSGQAKVTHFFLGNPVGFKTPSAMKVGSVLVKVDKKSLTGNTIVVDRIEVISPAITYEKKGNTDNFHAILNNIEKISKSEKQSKQASGKEGPGKKLIIRDFVVKNGKVNLALSLYGLGEKEISSPLPDIHLKNIGEKKNGESPADAFKEVFAALYGKITSPAVAGSLNKQLKTMGASLDTLKEGGIKQLGTTTRKAEEQLKDLGKKLKAFGK